jgi:hypothetical protein
VGLGQDAALPWETIAFKNSDSITGHQDVVLLDALLTHVVSRYGSDGTTSAGWPGRTGHAT